MPLDRRTFVAGLAVAGLVSAVPSTGSSAAPLVRVGPVFTPFDTEGARRLRRARQIMLTSRWHIDIRSDDEQTYRHVDSGGRIILATDNHPDRLRFVRPARVKPYRTEHLHDLAYAAVYCQFHAIKACNRRELEGRTGAFFLYPSGSQLPRLVTEDAPPLPRIEA